MAEILFLVIFSTVRCGLIGGDFLNDVSPVIDYIENLARRKWYNNL